MKIRTRLIPLSSKCEPKKTVHRRIFHHFLTVTQLLHDDQLQLKCPQNQVFFPRGHWPIWGNRLHGPVDPSGCFSVFLSSFSVNSPCRHRAGWSISTGFHRNGSSGWSPVLVPWLSSRLYIVCYTPDTTWTAPGCIFRPRWTLTSWSSKETNKYELDVFHNTNIKLIFLYYDTSPSPVSSVRLPRLMRSWSLLDLLCGLKLNITFTVNPFYLLCADEEKNANLLCHFHLSSSDRCHSFVLFRAPKMRQNGRKSRDCSLNVPHNQKLLFGFMDTGQTTWQREQDVSIAANSAN